MMTRKVESSENQCKGFGFIYSNIFQNVFHGSIVASIVQVLAPTSIEYVLVGGTF